MSRIAYPLLLTVATAVLAGTAALDPGSRSPALFLFVALGAAGAARAWQRLRRAPGR